MVGVTSCEYLIVMKDGTVHEGTVYPMVSQNIKGIKMEVLELHEVDTPDVESSEWKIKTP
jgi:hypothetical protein